MSVRIYLCVFLLFSAFADDSIAFATPDPLDDVLALEDNQYVAGPARPVTGQRERGDETQHGTFPGWGIAKPQDISADLAVSFEAPPLFTDSLLYTLMSLRR